MALSQLEPFEIKGEWWRSDGHDLLEVFVADPTSDKVGFDQSFALMQNERDRLSGSDPENACRGLLRFDPEGGLRLSLLGASSAVFGTEGDEFVVHGRTASGRPCTLLDCFVVNQTANFPNGFTEIEILANSLLHGAWVDAGSELIFDRAVITVPGLREFLWAPGHDAAGNRLGGLSGDPAERREVKVDGATITFSIGWRGASDVHSKSEERHAHVEVALEHGAELPVWQERWLRPLVRLISFACREGTRVDTFTALLSIDDEQDEEEPRRGPRVVPVDIVAPQRALARKPRLRWERMLLSYAPLGASFDDTLRRWWSIHDRLGGAADFLFGALAESLALEPQLVTLASVAEAYHRVFHDYAVVPSDDHARAIAAMLGAVDPAELAKHYGRRLRYADQPTQNDRVLAVLRRAGEAIEALGHKSGRLANAITAARNYYVHLPAEDASALDSAELYEVNQLLILALLVNLMLDLGLDSERVATQVQSSYASEPFWIKLQRRNSAWPKVKKPDA